MLQFVRPARGAGVAEFDNDLGVAAAVLRAGGFEPALAAMPGYRGDLLHRAVTQHRPVYVLADIPPTAIAAARHTIIDVAEKHFLPVAVVGRFVTSMTEKAISIPGVTAALPGEYESSALRLFQSIRDGHDTHIGPPSPAADLPGVWFNSEDGLVHNPMLPPVEDLDRLPWPQRDIFDYARIVRATGQAAFRATRGCPEWCGYCLNDWYMDLYGQQEGLRRRRSCGNLLDEVAEVVGRYEGVTRVAFEDHDFAGNAEWLGAFAQEYPRRCPLPYRCHLRPGAIDENVAGLLARSGCDLVDVEIGSGSSFIREDVLGIRAGRRQITDGVALLRAAGLAVRAGVFIGAPYESQVSVDETLALLAGMDLSDVRARVYYPVPGTRAAEVCAENGWISGRGEECFYENRSVLNMPSLPAQRIDEIARRFPALVRHTRGRSLGAWLKRLARFARRPVGGGRKAGRD